MRAGKRTPRISYRPSVSAMNPVSVPATLMAAPGSGSPPASEIFPCRVRCASAGRRKAGQSSKNRMSFFILRTYVFFSLRTGKNTDKPMPSQDGPGIIKVSIKDFKQYRIDNQS